MTTIHDTMSGNYLPPQNTDAEESILSAILIENEYLSEVNGILTPEDFYRPSHRKIFSAMVDLYGKQEPVDLVTLSEALRQRGVLEEVGGSTNLARLIDVVPMAANVEHYSKIVRDKADLRRLLAGSMEISRKCLADREPVADVVNFAERTVYGISGTGRSATSMSAIGSLVHGTMDRIEQRQNDPLSFSGVPTGFRGLDRLLGGLQSPDLILLAARPSMGKTSLAMNIARNAAVDQGVPALFFSIEMAKEQIVDRLLFSEARISSSKARNGMLGAADWGALTAAAGIINAAPFYIDDTANLNPMEIRAKIRRMTDQKPGLIVVDYLQLMGGSGKAERRDLEIAEISAGLKGIAKEFTVPVIALSQLNRELEKRADKRPYLSDLRESGSLEQDADIVMFVYRDEVYNREPGNPLIGKAELIVAKHRNGETGTVMLEFRKEFTLFEDLAPGC